MIHKDLLSAEDISPTENMTKRNSALRIAASVLGAAVLSLPLNLFLALQSGAWQFYVLVFLVIAIGTLGFIALRLIRKGRIESGIWVVLVGTMVILPLATFLISGFGLILGFVIVITSYIYASQTLNAKDVKRTLVASMGAGILAAITDLLNLGYRLQAPALKAFMPAITGLVLLVILFFIIRQAWERSMRNKLMVAFIGVTFVAAGALAVYVFTSTNTILQQGLERELTEHTDEAALRIGALINEQINTMTTLSLNEILQQTAEDANTTYEGESGSIQSVLDARDVQWRSADAANNNSDPLVRQYLSNQASLELVEFQQAFPNNAEIFITDVYGGLTGSTNRTSDYYQADEEWWQAAYNNGNGAVYISEPEFDESAGALAVLIALPLRNRETGEIIGILRTTYLTSALNSILRDQVGRTGETDLFVPGDVISRYDGEQYTQFDTGMFNEMQAAGQGMVEMDYEGIASVALQAPVQTLEGNPAVNKLGWVVVFHQDQDEAFAPVNTQVRGVLIVVAIFIGLAVMAALGLSLFLVRPIALLTKTAEEVAAGNLDSRAKVTSTDEIGILASTFNSMTSQLQETLGGLEQRVAARTRDLEIVAEVGTTTATIMESKRLLQEVVDLTKERFNLYHSHIYLLDDEGKNLVLTAGAGEPGRVMVAEGRSIPLDREQSLVARAARERKGVTVNDVTQAPDFLPNPLLPDTRSELAVPMIVGGKMIGVFDIQSDQVERFTDADVNIQTTMAAQLATSIQNVHSFEQSKKQADLESLVNVIGQRIQRTTSIEETLQTAIREIGTALGAQRVRANLVIDRQAGETPSSQN